ncbi:MAG: hypothetical protein P9L97_06155 [Candidatus Tenebribacter davisii]|nr:hypothetical protein [Candidatus Tenebribacter davisii]
MIDSIESKYFETHQDMHIELHEGVNILIGASDEGKSGLIRQIKWNAQNRPQGDSYRDDKLDPKKKEDKLKATEVIIKYKDSGTVTRARDGYAGGINHYQIDNQEPLRALKTDVPDEVQEITRMKEVNIQGQHPTEQYFLLADKPGQVAKQFNKVAGLTIMDDAIKSINSQVRSCNAEIGVHKKGIEDRQKELKETEWVLKAEKFAKKLEQFMHKAEHKKIEFQELSENIRLIKNIDEKLKEFDDIGIAKIALVRLCDQSEALSNKEDQRAIIQNTVEAIKLVDLKLSDSSDTVEALTALKALQKQKIFINKYNEQIEIVRDLLVKIKRNEEQHKIATKEVNEAIKQHDKIRAETECPVCGRSGL